MQIAQKLAGYSLGGADLLRRAMGKKKAEEMQKQKAAFIAGAEGNGVDPKQAEAIFDEIEGFASYGFNKSHSAAYAVVTYQTAYLKAHYPTEFFAAALTTDSDKIDKVVRTIAEARAWGVAVLPPDVNKSSTDFTVVYEYPEGNGPKKGQGKTRDRYGSQVRFGLGAVRGVGEAALESVFEARAASGEFRDLFDFAARVDSKRLNRGVLEALVQCGAFDTALAPTGVHRARAFAAIERALERARSATRDREAGQATLFGLFEAGGGGAKSSGDEYPEIEAWDRLEMLRREKAALGCYVSGHPLFRYGDGIQRLGAVSTARLREVEPWSVQQVAGVVENYRERLFKKGSGGKAAFFELEDASGRVSAKLRGDRIDTYAHLLAGGEPVLAKGKVSFPDVEEGEEEREREPTLFVDTVVPLSHVVAEGTKRLSLRLRAERTTTEQLSRLGRVLEASPGNCTVELSLGFEGDREAVLALPHTISPSDRMLGDLERIFGDTVAELY